MSYPWRVTLALIASFWLLLWPWNQLTQDAGTLLAASLTATAVLLVGGAAHRLAVPWPQLLALLTGGIGLIATVTALAGPAAVLRLPEFFVAGLGYIQSATAPVPANIGVSVIIVGAQSMSRLTGVPTYIAEVIQGMALIVMLIALLLTEYRIKAVKD